MYRLFLLVRKEDHHRNAAARSLLIPRVARVLGVGGLPRAVTLDPFCFVSNAGDLAAVGYEHRAVWMCLQVVVPAGFSSLPVFQARSSRKAGMYESGLHQQHVDSLWLQLVMQAFGEDTHVRLGRGVGAGPRDALSAQERSDQHDAAAAFIHHLPGEPVGKAGNDGHVEADHFQLARQRRVGKWPAGGEPGAKAKDDETDVEVACLLLEWLTPPGFVRSAAMTRVFTPCAAAGSQPIVSS